MAPLRLRVEERITEQAPGFRASNLTRPESSSSTREDGDSLLRGISFVSHVRSDDSSPRRKLSDEEGVANPCRTVRPIVTLMKVLDYRSWSAFPTSLDHHDHDYVAPRLLFVFPLCSCPPVLGLGGPLLFILATLR